jgi:cyanophycinase
VTMAGKLIIIGGAEEKAARECEILQAVAAAVRTRLVVVTVATELPEEAWDEYRRIFTKLGVRDLAMLDVRSRQDALQRHNVELLIDGATIFITGGDQLRLTSQVGDSPVFQRMQQLFAAGGVICGTSAGAAAVSDTMLIGGKSNTSNDVGDLAMAPGLGFLHGVVTDSHFTERGRIGRLLATVAQNPAYLGLGIDEDTAIVVTEEHGKRCFSVIGSGSVYVLDGSRISWSSLSDRNADGVAMCDVTLHVLRKSDRFDLDARRPYPGAAPADAHALH